MAHSEEKQTDPPDRRAQVRALPGVTPGARLMDKVARWVIAVGGVGVIGVVLGIFLLIFLECYPLFQRARVSLVGVQTLSSDAPVLTLGIDPYQEIVYAVRPQGVDFIRLETGELMQTERPDRLANRQVVSAYRSIEGEHVGLGMADGAVVLARVQFDLQFVKDGRVVTPKLNTDREVQLSQEGEAIVRVSYRSAGQNRSMVAGVTASGRLMAVVLEERRGLMGGGRVEVFHHDLTEHLEGLPTALVVDARGQRLMVGTDRGEFFRWDVEDPRVRPELVQRTVASEHAITALDYVLGDFSLVVGDAAGQVNVWSAVRENETSMVFRYEKIFSFKAHAAPVTAVAASQRDKQFLTADASGQVGLHHRTTAQTFFQIPSETSDIQALVFSPKNDGFLSLDTEGRIAQFLLHNPHPEFTLSNFFGKVHYEGYSQPEYVWQSTGGSDDFEPKLSVIPLAFGTAKGTLYAMLFALPLAILAAIYTSEFAHPNIRNKVKPVVELMASLPSVILGFLAGLWLAPLLDRHVVGALLLFPVLPLVIIGACWLWSRLPRRYVVWLPHQMEIYLLIPVVIFAGWLAFALGPMVEYLLFGGQFQTWLRDTAGTNYDQRNALVIGFAMGFAVIPIIYTICDDALTSVPGHLRAGSLALGATPWQTAIRVVLPTAIPGIFSAVMIGFGRAVGETMIVLMATGNTPIMEWNVFNGMRTLAANIAVEIPEAPHEGTLYRTLFLTGLLLTGLTFLVNTVAELVRQWFRERYSRI